MTRLEDFVKSPLAVVCHDAGAANLIVEWLKDYTGDLNVCMLGPAKIIWEKHFPDRKLISCNRAIKNSNSLLSGTGWGDTEHFARTEAKRRNIKNIAVIDHWSNYRERFVIDGHEELPDVIIVVDNYAYKQVKSLFPSILVFQLPNNYLQQEAKKAYSARQRECREPFENILIIGEPLREEISGINNYIEFDSIDFLMNNLKKINVSENCINFNLRLHPSEPIDKYDFLQKKFNDLNIQFNINKNNELFEDIAWADLVVGMNSFALIVALTAEVSVMSILPPESVECILPYEEIVHLREQ